MQVSMEYNRKNDNIMFIEFIFRINATIKFKLR